MHIELHDGLKKVQSIEATRVVVYDDHDNPIAAVIKIDGNQYVAVTAANKQFNSIIKAMGLNRTVLVDHMDTKLLKPLV